MDKPIHIYRYDAYRDRPRNTINSLGTLEHFIATEAWGRFHLAPKLICADNDIGHHVHGALVLCGANIDCIFVSPQQLIQRDQPRSSSLRPHNSPIAKFLFCGMHPMDMDVEAGTNGDKDFIRLRWNKPS